MKEVGTGEKGEELRGERKRREKSGNLLLSEFLKSLESLMLLKLRVIPRQRPWYSGCFVSTYLKLWVRLHRVALCQCQGSCLSALARPA